MLCIAELHRQFLAQCGLKKKTPHSLEKEPQVSFSRGGRGEIFGDMRGGENGGYNYIPEKGRNMDVEDTVDTSTGSVRNSAT